MSETTEPTARDEAPTVDFDVEGGMEVPAGIDALVQAVPSSIPAAMFDEGAAASSPLVSPPAPVARVTSPKPAVPRPPSVRQMSAVKPASTSRMAAVKAPSVRKMVAALSPSSPTIDMALDAPIATAQRSTERMLPVARAPVALEPASPAPERTTSLRSPSCPSSFPSSEKSLVLDIAPSLAPVAVAHAVDRLDSVIIAPEAEDEGAVRLPSGDKTLVMQAYAAQGAPPPPSSVGAVVTELREPPGASLSASALPQRGRPTAPSSPDLAELAASVLPKRGRALPIAVMIAAALVTVLLVTGTPGRQAVGRVLASRTSGAIVATPASALAKASPLEPASALDPTAPASVPPEAAPASVPLEAAPAPGPALAVEVPVVVRPGSGVLTTSDATPGRRIFVDRRAVGQTPQAVAVKCGSHRVRIGTAGKTLTVDVPCGGEIRVSDR